MPVDRAKAAGVTLAALWVAWGWTHGAEFWPLSALILLTHEAGHPIFGILGRFVGTAGGTLMQLIIPVVFMAGFFRSGQRASAAVASFWLVASLAESVRYARDALDPQLPLIHTGMTAQEEMDQYGETEHDWINMADMLGVSVGAVRPVAGLMTLAAMAIWLAGLAYGLHVAGVPLPMPKKARPPQKGPRRRK